MPVLIHDATVFLFFKILRNEIWKSGQNLPLPTFGDERVTGCFTTINFDMR